MHARQTWATRVAADLSLDLDAGQVGLDSLEVFGPTISSLSGSDRQAISSPSRSAVSWFTVEREASRMVLA